jgi:predicted phosphodiesterase
MPEHAVADPRRECDLSRQFRGHPAGIFSIFPRDVDPAAAGFQAVISGHSHCPKQREKDGVLFVNPGSAGRRRFTLPTAVGRLLVTGTRITADLIELKTSKG